MESISMGELLLFRDIILPHLLGGLLFGHLAAQLNRLELVLLLLEVLDLGLYCIEV